MTRALERRTEDPAQRVSVNANMIEQPAPPIQSNSADSAVPSEDEALIIIGLDIADLIERFLQNRRDDLVKLEVALAEGDWTILRGIGHGMKGTGGAYGAPTISTLGQTIEIAAQEKNRAIVKDALTSLESYLATVRVKVTDDKDS